MSVAKVDMPQPGGAQAGAPEVLRAADVTLVYQGRTGRVTALESLDLAVGQNEFVCVLGPSGCGKSTMLRLFSGLLRPTEGVVSIDDEPITGPRPDVGIVFQSPTLLPWRSVLNNVLMPIRAMGRFTSDDVARAEELLSLVGLSDFSNNYPNELSGGMQQRVGLARALIHDPRVLLMDEPFAALDALTRERMALELQSLWLRANKSVLFITHSIPEAVFLADRVIVLTSRPGRVEEVVDVDIPRPRSIDTMATTSFAETCNYLRRRLDAIAS